MESGEMEMEQQAGSLKGNVMLYGINSEDVVPLKSVIAPTSSTKNRRQQMSSLSGEMRVLLEPLTRFCEMGIEVLLRSSATRRCFP